MEKPQDKLAPSELQGKTQVEVLEELARRGARELLARAMEAEVAEHVEKHCDLGAAGSGKASGPGGLRRVALRAADRGCPPGCSSHSDSRQGRSACCDGRRPPTGLCRSVPLDASRRVRVEAYRRLCLRR